MASTIKYLESRRRKFFGTQVRTILPMMRTLDSAMFVSCEECGKRLLEGRFVPLLLINQTRVFVIVCEYGTLKCCGVVQHAPAVKKTEKEAVETAVYYYAHMSSMLRTGKDPTDHIPVRDESTSMYSVPLPSDARH